MTPVLLGQWLSLWYYRRQCKPWSKVTEHVWIGCRLSRQEAHAAIEAGVTAVLDLTAEFDEIEPLRQLHYCGIPVLDLTAPTPEQLQESLRFIAAHAQAGIVYVHCKAGYSRSAAIVAAYLIDSGDCATASEALSVLRCARPTIVVRPEIKRMLNMT